MSDTSENWAPIPGYEAMYEVSDKGRVKSLPREARFEGRWGPAVAKVPGRMMKADRTRGGYLQIDLRKDGKGKKHLVHRLVMAAFQGESTLQVNHRDGDKINIAKLFGVTGPTISNIKSGKAWKHVEGVGE